MFYAGCSCFRLNLAASNAFWNHCTTIVVQVSLSNLPFLLIQTCLQSSTSLQWVRFFFRRWGDQDQVLHSKCNSSCIIRKKPEPSADMLPLNLLIPFQQCINPPTHSLSLWCFALRTASHRSGSAALPTGKFSKELQYSSTAVTLQS